jgi:uncharacterized protein with PIN domain
MLGQDVISIRGEDDMAILRKAVEDGRILLTRDKRLAAACQKGGTCCILITGSDLDDQLLQMEDSGVELRLDPNRCTICNAMLKVCHTGEVDMQSAQVEDAFERCFNEFGLEQENRSKSQQKAATMERSEDAVEAIVWICDSCGKLYWRGGHWDRIKERMGRLHQKNCSS